MRHIVYVGIILLLVLTVTSCGCGEKGGFPLRNTTKPVTKTTITATPTPAFGSLFITTNPIGADVYLEGVYQGVAPLNLSNIHVGKYNLSLKMERFVTNNFTAEVKGGQVTRVSKTMVDAAPKLEITLTNASVQEVPPCIWTFTGTIKNIGTDQVHDVDVTIEMKPKNSEYKTVIESTELGDINPGLSLLFGFQVTVLCDGDYRPTIKAEGMDWNNPAIESDDKKVSTSKTI